MDRLSRQTCHAWVNFNCQIENFWLTNRIVAIFATDFYNIQWVWDLIPKMHVWVYRYYRCTYVRHIFTDKILSPYPMNRFLNTLVENNARSENNFVTFIIFCNVMQVEEPCRWCYTSYIANMYVDLVCAHIVGKMCIDNALWYLISITPTNVKHVT